VSRNDNPHNQGGGNKVKQPDGGFHMDLHVFRYCVDIEHESILDLLMEQVFDTPVTLSI
jgi:hypothetical protein